MVVITLKFWRDHIPHAALTYTTMISTISHRIYDFLNTTKYNSVQSVKPILMENDEWTIAVTFNNPKQETLFCLEYSEYITAVNVNTVQDDYTVISVLAGS